jgi:uncharacterized coiled-coil protein SlyX
MGLRYNKEYIPKDRRIQTHGPRDLQRKQAAGPEVDMRLVAELQATIASLREELNRKPAAAPEGMFTAEQVNDEIIKAVKIETADLKEKYEEKLKAIEIDKINLTNSNRELKEKLEVIEQKTSESITEVEAKYKDAADNIKTKYDLLLEERDSKISNLKEKIENQDNLIKKLESSNTTGGLSQEQMQKMLAEVTDKMQSLALAAGHNIEDVDPDRPKMETVFIDPIEKAEDVESHITVEEDVSITKKEEMAAQVSKLKNLIGSLPTKKG